MSYSSCLKDLEFCFPTVVSDIKSDLKNEHLKSDKAFMKKFFPGKKISGVSSEELAVAYMSFISDSSHEEMAKFIGNRWLLRHTDIYDFFENRLKGLQDDLEEVSSIPNDISKGLLEDALKLFGAVNVFLFSKLNFVVFSEREFSFLREQAESAYHASRIVLGSQIRKFEESGEFITLRNRYEKKLAGLRLKYLNDTASLKKQIAGLHKKLHSKTDT